MTQANDPAYPVSVISSNGFSKNGEQYVFIRPTRQCFNRSRRCLKSNAERTIKKWFTPINYYEIQGHIIGSNNEVNALKEYWRVCAPENIGKQFVIASLNKEK